MKRSYIKKSYQWFEALECNYAHSRAFVCINIFISLLDGIQIEVVIEQVL
ncbi:hypothetical protein [Clostridium sp. UBA5988]